jgi:signal transduction histidine kinase
VDKKLEARIPSTTADVQTDIVLLEMVLENFWTNALKYSRDHDTIIVEVVQNDASTTISVHDEGIGISAQDRKRIGEKFFRAKNALSVNVDGTGLGLYMCKLIAKTLGADFSLESEEGKGTTASITLHAHDNAVQG